MLVFKRGGYLKLVFACSLALLLSAGVGVPALAVPGADLLNTDSSSLLGDGSASDSTSNDGSGAVTAAPEADGGLFSSDNAADQSSPASDGKSGGEQTGGENSGGDKTGSQVEERLEEPPALSEVLVLADALESERLRLQDKLSPLLDFAKLSKSRESLMERFGSLPKRFETATSTDAYSFEQVQVVLSEAKEFEQQLRGILNSVSSRTSTIEGLRSRWKGYLERWKAWRGALLKNANEPQRAALDAAVESADKAVLSLSQADGPLLTFQRKVLDDLREVATLARLAEGVLVEIKSDLFRRSRPPMYSSQYYAQFTDELMAELRAALTSVRMPDAGFFGRNAWIIVLHVVLILMFVRLLTVGGGKVPELVGSPFLKERPVSTALVFGILGPMPFYDGVQSGWEAMLWAMVGVATARLATLTFEHKGQRTLVWALALVSIANTAIDLIPTPIPIYRLYVVAVTAGAVALFIWVGRRAARRGSTGLVMATKAGWIIAAMVMLVQVGGYADLANHLLDAIVETGFIALLAWLCHLLLGDLIRLFIVNALGYLHPIFHDHSKLIVRRVWFVADAVIFFMSFAEMLAVWRIYDGWSDSASGILRLGIEVGGHEITLGLVIAASGAFFGVVLASWLVQRLLDFDVYPRRHVDRGVALSVNRLINYGFLVIASVLALSILGLGLQNLTILAGALSIGVGFGLQNIVSNFASGLILLFERPVKVGDMVQFQDQWGHVLKVGLRATVVQTLDRAEIIVPNSELVSTPVTNWTLSDRRVRAVVSVGIAYGSNVELAVKTLQRVAREHEMVLADPEPQVLFSAFGDSSLNFDLRVWIDDAENRLLVASDLHMRVDKAFREAGIEIAFPQRDLHLRTIDGRAFEGLAKVGSGRDGAAGGERQKPREQEQENGQPEQPEQHEEAGPGEPA